MTEAIEVSQHITDSQERSRLEASQQAGHALLIQLWEARAEITRLKAELHHLRQAIKENYPDLHVTFSGRDSD